MLGDSAHSGEEAATVFGDACGRFDDCERLEDEGHARRVVAAEVVVGDDAVDRGGLRVGEVRVVDDGHRDLVAGFHAVTVARLTFGAQVALGAFRLATHGAFGNYAP